MKVTVQDKVGLYIEQNVTCENFKIRGILDEMYSIFCSHPFNKYSQALFWYLRYISGQNTFICPRVAWGRHTKASNIINRIII